jgi:hypothetical protein
MMIRNGVGGALLAVSFAVDDIDGVYRNLVATGVSFPGSPETQPCRNRRLPISTIFKVPKSGKPDLGRGEHP